MKLFGKKEEPSAPICKICNMEFMMEERMIRHMTKAHSRPTGWKKSNGT
ncbi:MAG TPA: hypothetical protein VLD38_08105 [Nitrosopumilaceae archaeon]|nr:hypothetical protein [Nitrosopumilaceae archaeon]